MTDPLLGAGTDAPGPRIRAALKGALIFAVVVVAAAGNGGRVSKSAQEWAYFTLALFILIHVMADVRRGRTQIPSRGGEDPRYDYVRSADPIGFWVLIALQGVVAIAIAVGALGGLLGLWKL